MEFSQIRLRTFSGKFFFQYGDNPAVQRFLLAIEDISLTKTFAKDGSPTLSTVTDWPAIMADFIWMLSPGLGGYSWTPFGTNERSEAIRVLKLYLADLRANSRAGKSPSGYTMAYYLEPLDQIIDKLDNERLIDATHPINIFEIALDTIQAINPAPRIAENARRQARERNEEIERMREKFWEKYGLDWDDLR